MGKWECSILADRLQEYINRKIERLDKLTDKPRIYKSVQEEVILLQDVLTYIQAETNIFNMVVIDLVGKALMQAQAENCNDIVAVIPIKDNYKDRPKVGVFNPKSGRKPIYSEDAENNNVLSVHKIRYSLHNIDGVGDVEPDVIYLNNKI